MLKTGHMFIRSLLILLVVGLGINIASAQQSARVISGLIVCEEEQRPLEGVSVIAKGSTLLTGSQPDGVFYLPVSASDSVLLVQLEGFEPKEIKLGTVNEYKITLRRKRNIERTFQGEWRGEFLLQDLKLPFRFAVEKQGAVSKAYFINGEERFESGPVELRGDSLYITSLLFDTELAFKLDGETIQGSFRRQDGSGRAIPVHAERGVSNRFLATSTPIYNISGKYDVIFTQADGSTTKSVGLFTQKGHSLQAVFLKTTGDSRFLEGVVNGDQLQLSSFIGSSPSYYEAEISKDGNIEGKVRGLGGSSQSFIAVKNDQASLPDPYALTYLKPGFSQFNFALPNLAGKTISLKDPAYAGKVVVITLTGSWCPNCMDEASFLSPWYKKNRERGVEVIAIHFERNTNPDFLKKSLGRFQERFDVTYEQLIGGIADKKSVAETFPALNSFLAFPTTLFIDKKGNVAKIYTGYSGPATGEYHEQFIKEFNAEIDKLLAQ